jgi:hypothetical protein
MTTDAERAEYLDSTGLGDLCRSVGGDVLAHMKARQAADPETIQEHAGMVVRALLMIAAQVATVGKAIDGELYEAEIDSGVFGALAQCYFDEAEKRETEEPMMERSKLEALATKFNREIVERAPELQRNLMKRAKSGAPKPDPYSADPEEQLLAAALYAYTTAPTLRETNE